VACALASFAVANTGAAATANPATTLRLVIEVEPHWIVISLARDKERGKADFDDGMGASFVTAVRPCCIRFDATERRRFLKYRWRCSAAG
jgi:hypothetical protein